MTISFTLFVLVTGVVAQQNFSIGDWQGTLADGSGVLQSLKSASNLTFDFSPSDYFQYRDGVGNYHTGDLTMRWREVGQFNWSEVDTAAQRNISPVSTQSSSILHSDFTSVFPDTASFLNISREWMSEGGDLVLSATVENVYNNSVEIGAFGFPIEFNSIFYNRTADETTQKCVLIDPYIGLDAGYVQVTRLTGTGPNLVVTPYGNNSRFEGWRFLHEATDGTLPYQSQVFEGYYAWQTLTKAYAENEWNETEPWNDPTSIVLSPGQSVTFALRFSSAADIYRIESTVSTLGMPVAVGVPGYILPHDMVGRLFIDSENSIQSITTMPNGSISFNPSTAPNASWIAYDVIVSSETFGRARATVEYSDGALQTIHYFLTQPTIETSEKFSGFLFDKQWYADTSDPFHRADSIISYDYEVSQYVLQDSRVWIAGISDEGGAGSFEAAAMKSSVHPDRAQTFKLEQMVNTSVWGVLQDSNGDQEFGVKRSVFFYEPDLVTGYQYGPELNWNTSWNQSEAFAIWRTYDYVHVSALYWSLYRTERVNPGILQVQSASWYLSQAYQTVIKAVSNDTNGEPVTDYADVGLMCETHWVYLLDDLKSENMTEQANDMEAAMKARQQLWASQSNPFGSEMAWDSTGQEGVYAWSRYFGDNATMTKTLNSIRGYMPTVAHWGWNGNARRYWDFLYAGKLTRIERMIHHYGSGLNALPLLDAYKYNADPSGHTAFYDLRVGYGGMMGPLSNINADGFGAMAFHSWPDTMKWDAYSGDYGPNYLGHVLGSATYLVNHPDFGWISMGGNVDIEHDGDNTTVTVSPKDTVRRRLYVASMGLSVEFDGGVVSNFTLSLESNSLIVHLENSDGSSSTGATMTFEDTLNKGARLLTKGLENRLGGYFVPFGSSINFAL